MCDIIRTLYEIGGGYKVKDEIMVTKVGQNVEISTSDSKFIIPEETINAVAELTNDTDEAVELFSYLKERVDSFNGTVEIRKGITDNDKKFKYTPAFVRSLCISLLSAGFVPEQIMSVLNEMHEGELFGSDTIVPVSTDEERIIYIVGRVKNALDYLSGIYSEEATYSNVDERIYHGV